MYCWFIHSSFSGSNTDGDAPTRSSENSRSISSRERISRSPPGAQPRSARKLNKRLGQDARVPPLLDRGGSVALGELLLVRAEDHAQVGELGDRRAERPEERDVLGRVGEVVVPANDVGDRASRRRRRRRRSGRAGARRNGRARSRRGPPPETPPGRGSGRRPRSSRRACARRTTCRSPARARRSLSSGEMSAARRPSSDRRGRPPPRLLALGVELLGRLEGPVGLALANEPLGRRPVEVVAARLVEGSLVVAEAQPLHRREDLRRSAPRATARRPCPRSGG